MGIVNRTNGAQSRHQRFVLRKLHLDRNIKGDARDVFPPQAIFVRVGDHAKDHGNIPDPFLGDLGCQGANCENNLGFGRPDAFDDALLTSCAAVQVVCGDILVTGGDCTISYSTLGNTVVRVNTKVFSSAPGLVR